MKEDIHPKWYPEARVICACGNTWTTGATQEELRTDVCSACHPFYTGEMQRIVDRAGQVDRFKRRLQRAEELQKQEEEQAPARKEREEARRLVEIVDEDEELEPIEAVGEQAEEESTEE